MMFLAGCLGFINFNKLIIIMGFLAILTSCKLEDLVKNDLYNGFEKISNHESSYFVFVHEEYWGNKAKQRKVGADICKDEYIRSRYCEVYFFASKNDIPKQFPILNRMNPIGMYEMKYGERRLKTLPGEKTSNGSSVTFFKKILESQSILNSTTKNKERREAAGK